MSKTLSKIIIGARGSKMSLVQTNTIKETLQALLPTSTITIQVIKTTGDTNMNPVPLDSIGKGWFTKELDRALITETVDMAVHSLKDLPEVLPPGLIIAATPAREDAREALVSSSGLTFQKLKRGAVIGTDSARRKTQILQKRPDLRVESIRGNVDRRIEKLDNGQYDAVILAAAGLKRVGLEDRIVEYFDETDFIPSPGQGALAIVIKEENKLLQHAVTKLSDRSTVIAVTAERAFAKAMGGGCKMPVGAYAKVLDNTIIIHGVVGSLDGQYLEQDSLQGNITKPIALGKTLASRLLQKAKPWHLV